MIISVYNIINSIFEGGKMEILYQNKITLTKDVFYESVKVEL